jgi:hypothetical protein
MELLMASILETGMDVMPAVLAVREKMRIFCKVGNKVVVMHSLAVPRHSVTAHARRPCVRVSGKVARGCPLATLSISASEALVASCAMFKHDSYLFIRLVNHIIVNLRRTNK